MLFKGIAAGIKPPSIEVERGKKDLYWLCRDVLGYRDGNETLHREYCDFVSFITNPKSKKLDLMPREHFKTTMGTIGLAIQEILNDPNTTILISNYTWSNARKFLDAIKKQFQFNEKLRGLYGDYVGDKWNEDEIIVSKRTKFIPTPTIETAGLEKTLTSNHYKLIILDDLVSRENINTYEAASKVIRYYQDSLDLLDKVSGRLIIHGTRWSFYELYGWILKSHSKSFDVYIRRAVEDGKVIFPERFSKGKLKELMYEKGMNDFSCQYFNHVYDVKNSLIGVTDVNYYTDEDLGTYRSKYPLYITMVADGAVSEDRASCKTAITVVGTTINDEWILLDVRAGHWGPQEAVEEMVAAILKWRPVDFGMQETSFEKLYRINLEKTMSERSIYAPNMVMLSKDPRVSKDMQIMSLKPRIERKGLFWKPTQEQFEIAGRQYPKTTDIDILDSLSRHTELSQVPIHHSKAGRRETRFNNDALGEPAMGDYALPWNQ